jgi:FdhD protein
VFPKSVTLAGLQAQARFFFARRNHRFFWRFPKSCGRLWNPQKARDQALKGSGPGEMDASGGAEDCAAVQVSTAAIGHHTALRIQNAAGSGKTVTRGLAGEVPISFSYNGLAHAVMMATPQALEDFATGFTLTQEIVTAPSGIEAIEVRELPAGFLVQINIPEERFRALAARRRNLVGQTGCGLCGVIELTQAVRDLVPIAQAPRLSPQAIFRALEASRGLQSLNHATGAMHAAFLMSPDGKPRLVREDAGRHNALDKLIGAMTRGGVDADDGFVLLTSRCSYELVEKAVIARVPALVTISMPTTLAVARAEAARLTLVCLARPDSFLVFNDPFGIFANFSSQNGEEQV